MRYLVSHLAGRLASAEQRLPRRKAAHAQWQSGFYAERAALDARNIGHFSGSFFPLGADFAGERDGNTSHVKIRRCAYEKAASRTRASVK